MLWKSVVILGIATEMIVLSSAIQKTAIMRLPTIPPSFHPIGRMFALDLISSSENTVGVFLEGRGSENVISSMAMLVKMAGK